MLQRSSLHPISHRFRVVLDLASSNREQEAIGSGPDCMIVRGQRVQVLGCTSWSQWVDLTGS